MFFKGSRYEKVGEAETTDRSGRVIRYKKVRFIPEAFARTQIIHAVSGGDRLDLISFQYYRDPEKFWLICDANGAMWPEDLVAKPGRYLLIPPLEDRT